jgi:hypothetical protein
LENLIFTVSDGVLVRRNARTVIKTGLNQEISPIQATTVKEARNISNKKVITVTTTTQNRRKIIIGKVVKKYSIKN